MPPRIFANIDPRLLVWARESAGLPVELAAKRVGVDSERLLAWEHGDDRPSIPQLRKSAAVYKRPLAVFFLPEPPATPPPLHDFRRLDAANRPQGSPELLTEFRRARRRRQIAIEIASESDEGIQDIPIRATTRDDPERLAQAARDWLGITVRQQATWRGEYGPLNDWLSVVEARPILVFQTGDIDLREMRGFSISEYPMPAIVLNATDAPKGRAFTLAHELVHLFLRNGGVCDPVGVSDTGRTDDERVEVFCNLVAGAIMVPSDELVNEPSIRHAGHRQVWDEAMLRELSERYAVSREVIVRRLLILGKTTSEFYELKREEYRQQFVAARERAKEAGGFAPYPRVVVRDLGKRYTRLVLEALNREQITRADVSDYLGVRLKHLPDIVEAAQSPARDA